MANPPKTPNNQTTPQERSEQLRAALAAREAGRTLNAPPVSTQASESEAARALDTFEASLIPATLVSVIERTRDEGELGENFTGEQELGQDEENLAGELGNLLDDDEDEDEARRAKLAGEEEEEEDDSPFNFSNPGKERVTEMAEGLFGDLGQSSSEGEATGEEALRQRVGEGKDAVAEDLGGGGYTEEQSSLDDGEMAALLSGDVTGLLGARNAALNAELDVMTGLLGDVANTSTSKTSVAQGNDPLGDAINSANSPEAQKEAADKYGVTPPSGSGQGAGTGGGAAPAAPPAAEKPWYERAVNSVSQAIYGRDFMGDAGTGTGLANRNQATELKAVDSGGGTLAPGDKATAIQQSKQIDGAPAAAPATLGSVFSGYANQVKEADAARKAKEDAEATKAEEEAKKAEDEAKKKEEEATKEEEAKKDGGGAKMSGDPDDPDGDLGGPPTEAEIAFRQYLYNATGYKGAGAGQQGGEVDPADDSTASSAGIAPTGIRAQSKEELIGQPAGPDMQTGGGGSLSGGNLPGDQGNIDFGEENDTAPFTSNQRGGDPGDLDLSVGGALVAKPPESSEDEEDDDSNNVVKSPFRIGTAKEVRPAGKAAFDDDDDD